VLFEAAKRIRLMPGAAVFVATAKAHGAYVAIVTGGFTFFARQVQAMLNIDAALANELIVEDGKLTGAVREPILNEKRAALLRLAAQQGVPLRSTLALGDGANDLPMLDAAGLGVAFHAKPAVVEQARVHVDHGDLTSLLYAQGYRISEFARP
jgi:phosphoserine phosphatase